MHEFMQSQVTAGPGWEAFFDLSKYLEYALILVTSTVSGFLLAYHPINLRRPASLEDIELRKTLIIYTTVGALIAIICTANPSMAFVIFGIGGLMRFRTNLEASKSTGHAIMGTVVGLCWGLELQLVAAFATVYFWAMIFAMERNVVMSLAVGGVKINDMPASSEEYRKAVASLGCRMLSQEKNFKKVQTTYVFRLPRKVTIEQVALAVDKIPENLRGTPDWP
ncbi:MAG: hypothetical protein M0R76_04325 [Proteobacteria bacterium]|nr:hypothetical protein [Pseudomonadota bacterium]